MAEVAAGDLEYCAAGGRVYSVSVWFTTNSNASLPRGMSRQTASQQRPACRAVVFLRSSRKTMPGMLIGHHDFNPGAGFEGAATIGGFGRPLDLMPVHCI